jgi:hypothetical protein
MKAPAIPYSSSLLALAITASGSALAPQTASDTDKRFDAKVSQADGMRWRPAIWHCRRPPTQNVSGGSRIDCVSLESGFHAKAGPP